MQRLVTILRDALRGLRAGKGTTLLAFSIISLAIAAGTVTFSVVDTVALRRLPFEDPGQLVAVARIESRTARLGGPAPQDYFAWKDRVSAFESLGVYRNNVVMPLKLGDAPQRLSVARVTTNFFDVLRARPAVGRLFGPEHDATGPDAVVVLSHSLWVRAFAGDPNAVGRSVMLGPTARTIIGVLPVEITYPIGLEPATDAYIPSIATPAERSDASPGRTFNAYIVGRLRPGADIAQAQREIDAVNASRVGASGRPIQSSHRVIPLLDHVVGEARPWLLLVLAGVGCVLLVACVNVANLFLARATVRVRELATREVLGASRGHIALALIGEGLLLTLGAGVAGIAAASWGVSIAKTMLPQGLARASTIGLDARVLTVSMAVVLLCGGAFASAPAWLASRIDLFSATRTSSGAVIGGRRRVRSLGAFLIGETAFVSALLVATALIVTSFVLITTADLGFNRRNVMAFGVQKTIETIPKAERATAGATLRADLLQRVRAMPGVLGAALIEGGVPLGGGSSYSVRLPGESGPVNDRMFAVREVTADYFSTMGVTLVAGRGIEPSDRAGTTHVGIINEAAVRRFFSQSNPIGQVLTFRGPVTIVGVVRTVRIFGPEVDPEPELYVALDQAAAESSEVGADLVVRTAGPAAALAPAIRDTVRAALGDGEVFQPRFIDDVFRRMTASRRFNARLMTIFGIIGLVIGAIGIYGTMAFVVAQEVRAIGLRMALGATPGRVRRSVLTDALWRVFIGLVIGLAGAWAASGWLTSLVFGLQPTSPAVYAGVAIVMVVVAALAALVPAVRASRVDPLVALRTE